MFLNFNIEFKADFENRKLNYPNRKWNYPNRKWNYFSYFLTSDQKTSLTKCFFLLTTSQNLGLKIGNRIIQTGNRIIFPNSWPPIKKLSFKMFLNFINEFEANFENRKWNYPNRKWNYFSYFLTSNQKTSFTKCF